MLGCMYVCWYLQLNEFKSVWTNIVIHFWRSFSVKDIYNNMVAFAINHTACGVYYYVIHVASFIPKHGVHMQMYSFLAIQPTINASVSAKIYVTGSQNNQKGYHLK